MTGGGYKGRDGQGYKLSAERVVREVEKEIESKVTFDDVCSVCWIRTSADAMRAACLT